MVLDIPSRKTNTVQQALSFLGPKYILRLATVPGIQKLRLPLHTVCKGKF